MWKVSCSSKSKCNSNERNSRGEYKHHRMVDVAIVHIMKTRKVLSHTLLRLHWILTLIDPHKEVVYLLDPLGSRIHDESWKNIVDSFLVVFKDNKQPKFPVT